MCKYIYILLFYATSVFSTQLSISTWLWNLSKLIKLIHPNVQWWEMGLAKPNSINCPTLASSEWHIILWTHIVIMLWQKMTSLKVEYMIIIKFLVKLGKSTTEHFKCWPRHVIILVCLEYKVFQHINKKERDEDYDYSSRPQSEVTDTNINRINEVQWWLVST